jgi:23S rRNA (uracil1939-C5)-methyltransferase
MNFSQRDLYTQTIPKEAWNLETWIVNPPRSGLNPLLIDQVQTLKPKSIIYSSCNPQTLKRDFESLQKFGYQIKEMSLVDFFPRTHHYEVLLNLSL